ncbi:MAG: hypothetical protein ACPGYV_11670 [Phycisphaeraceae bacterium]
MQQIKQANRKPVITFTEHQRQRLHEAGLRGEKIRAARRLIERGELETPSRLDVASERLLDDLMRQAA